METLLKKTYSKNMAGYLLMKGIEIQYGVDEEGKVFYTFVRNKETLAYMEEYHANEDLHKLLNCFGEINKETSAIKRK